MRRQDTDAALRASRWIRSRCASLWPQHNGNPRSGQGRRGTAPSLDRDWPCICGADRDKESRPFAARVRLDSSGQHDDVFSQDRSVGSREDIDPRSCRSSPHQRLAPHGKVRDDMPLGLSISQNNHADVGRGQHVADTDGGGQALTFPVGGGASGTPGRQCERDGDDRQIP